MARLLKVPSELGKQLDSLADMVTFGVAPGIIVMVLLMAPDIEIGYITIKQSPVTEFVHLANEGHFDVQEPAITGAIDESSTGEYSLSTELKCCRTRYPFNLLGLLGLIIPVFALFRLAKFNLDTRQSDSFIGLPTPAMTLFFAVIPIAIHSAYTQLLAGEIHYDSIYYKIAGLFSNPWFLIISAIVMSVLMVVELPLFALKFKHFKWKGNEIRYIFLTMSIAFLATLFFWAIPLIIILYVILSLINTRFVKQNG